MDIPDNIDSKFRFVLVAAGRAEQIMRGAPSKLKPMQGKATTLALAELKQDLVPWGMGKAEEPEAAQVEPAEPVSDESN